MTKLQKHHNITQFTGKKERAHDLRHVLYDSERGMLTATDATILINSPIDGCDAKSAIMSGADLARAVDQGGELTEKSGRVCVGDKACKSTDAVPFPDVVAAVGDADPDVVVCLNVEILQNLMDYAAENEAELVAFGLNHAKGKNWQERTVSGPVRFLIQPNTAAGPADVHGAIMAAEPDEGRLQDAMAAAIAGVNPNRRAQPVEGKPQPKRSRGKDKKSSEKPASGKSDSNGRAAPKSIESGSPEDVKKLMDRAKEFLAERKYIRAKRPSNRAVRIAGHLKDAKLIKSSQALANKIEKEHAAAKAKGMKGDKDGWK